MTGAIIIEKNELQRILDQIRVNPELHPLIEKLNEWEKKSIEKIQQRTEQLRRQLLELTGPHQRQLSQKLQNLSDQIRDDVLTENDLQRWKTILDALKKDLQTPSTIAIDEYMTDPLVRDIYVVSITTNELFLQTSDEKVRVEENGQLAIHDASINTTDIGRRNAYATGCHQIRLRVEQSNNQWTFVGINSKLIPLQNPSYICRSCCGWVSNQSIWSNGQVQRNVSAKLIEMRTNDVISLVLDCDRCSIMMINERSKIRHELAVQIDQCPLPWQLHVILHEPNSRLRILS